jgi:hypothetical protein
MQGPTGTRGTVRRYENFANREGHFVSGPSAQFAKRQWSFRPVVWPTRTDWTKACCLGAVIGIALGLNDRVWPWHLLTTVPRTFYWLALALVTTVQWMLAAAMLPRFGTGWAWKIARPVAILIVLSPACGLEFAVFSHWMGVTAQVPFAVAAARFTLIFLQWSVVLVLPIVLIADWRDERRCPDAAPAPVPDRPSPHDVVLQAKLPPPLRGPILALRAEDHYVRVFTAKGDTLVLMRFADAVSCLGRGIQTHRSYWVSEDAIEGILRNGRRKELRLTNGLVVPISRACELGVRTLREIN